MSVTLISLFSLNVKAPEGKIKAGYVPDAPPPPEKKKKGCCRALHSPWGEDFRLQLWAFSEGWRWLHTATLCGGQRGSGKKLQLSDFNSNKQTHTHWNQILSYFVFLFVHQCVSVLRDQLVTFLQWKCKSHTNEQTQGLRPYLHAGRDSPPWLHD